jgi:hypothetical protein
MLQADVFAVLLMNELKNLTDVVIGKLGKTYLYHLLCDRLHLDNATNMCHFGLS